MFPDKFIILITDEETGTPIENIAIASLFLQIIRKIIILYPVLADVSASNLPGSQTWELNGVHFTELDGVQKSATSSKVQSY